MFFLLLVFMPFFSLKTSGFYTSTDLKKTTFVRDFITHVIYQCTFSWFLNYTTHLVIVFQVRRAIQTFTHAVIITKCMPG
jgi:hypothetical protein